MSLQIQVEPHKDDNEIWWMERRIFPRMIFCYEENHGYKEMKLYIFEDFFLKGINDTENCLCGREQLVVIENEKAVLSGFS